MSTESPKFELEDIAGDLEGNFDAPHLDDYTEEELLELAALGDEILEEIGERS